MLVLSKPIGTGLVMTAVRAGMDRAGELAAAAASMATLNKAAAAAMLETGVSAATDITGFGLLGHAREMALASKVALEISFGRVPLLPGAVRAAGMGLIPGGAYANREYVACGLEAAANVGEREIDILCDPQTSGGLLLAVPQDKADALLNAMQRYQVPAAVIGHVTRGTAGGIRVTL